LKGRNEAQRPKKPRPWGKIAVFGFILIVIFIVFAQVGSSNNQPQNPYQTPTQNRGFLAAYVGKPVFMEYMNPFCVHCQNMAPVLRQLYAEYGTNVTFISVSDGSVSDTQMFINTYHTPWTYLYDSTGTVAAQYGVSGTPTFFLINSSGQIVQTIEGETSLVTLQTAMSSIQ